MKPALVTGATGFLGWHVARKLLASGEHVRVLVRDRGRLRELDGVDVRVGDLTDRESLTAAVTGCGSVFHVAADYRLWVRNPTEMYATNVDGTRNVMDAARTAGVERIVYTSTVGCIGIPPEGVGTEETAVRLGDMTGDYKRSKYLAEQAVIEAARAGLPVVIVNPTAPVGDHDFKPTPTGKIIVDFIRRKMPAYLDTGLNLVDVRDAAAGHLLAREKGRPGERYVLGQRNMNLGEIFGVLERVSGVAAPRREIPYALAWLAGAVSTGMARLTGVEPRAPLDGVRMARKKMFVSSEKAERELGYSPIPVEEALERAVAWFRANGFGEAR